MHIVFKKCLNISFPECQESDVYFCTFFSCKLIFPFFATEFKVIGLIKKSVTHYGTIDGTITVFIVESML